MKDPDTTNAETPVTHAAASKKTASKRDVASPSSIDPTIEAEARPKSKLPDWAPWAVLGTLVAVSVVGGTGLVRTEGSKEAAAPESPPTSSPTVSPPTGSSALPSREKLAPDGAEAITVSHIIVAYAGTPLGKVVGTQRTPEESKQRAEEARGRALKGEDFGALALEYSDEKRAKETKGSLGKLRHRDAVNPFADVAFGLKVGEVSEVIKSPFGYQVIKRVE
jgi:hypothetical protein